MIIDGSSTFSPVFIKEMNRPMVKSTYKLPFELLGIDPMESINETKKKYSSMSVLYDPKFQKISTIDDYFEYINRLSSHTVYEEQDDDCQPIRFEALSPHFFKFKALQNLSVCRLKLKMINIGNIVLEDFKLYLQFENVIHFGLVYKNSGPLDSNKYLYDIKFVKDGRMEFCPQRNVLVQGDGLYLDDLCFRTSHKAKFAVIKWELFARNTYQNGELRLRILPQFEHRDSITFVDDKKEFPKRIKYRSKFTF